MHSTELGLRHCAAMNVLANGCRAHLIRMRFMVHWNICTPIEVVHTQGLYNAYPPVSEFWEKMSVNVHTFGFSVHGLRSAALVTPRVSVCREEQGYKQSLQAPRRVGSPLKWANLGHGKLLSKPQHVLCFVVIDWAVLYSVVLYYVVSCYVCPMPGIHCILATATSSLHGKQGLLWGLRRR